MIKTALLRHSVHRPRGLLIVHSRCEVCSLSLQHIPYHACVTLNLIVGYIIIIVTALTTATKIP